MRLAIAVDLGATNLRVALGDESGRFLRRKQENTTRESGEALVEQIIRMIREVAGSELERVEAVGIGSIGPLDLRRGALLNPPNLPLGEVELTKPISEALGKPVYLLNDCVAAVVGEKMFGAGKDVDNLVYVTISTGIGCGVYVNGHLLLGKDGNAHEMGHVVIDLHGTMECGCGRRGHWEAYCSGANIPRYAAILLERMGRERASRSRLWELYQKGELTAKAVYDAAREGDPIAREIVEEIGRLNAIGIANIVNAYDPELITIGGSVALNNPDLVLEPIKRHVGEYAINRLPEIMLTPLGGDVVLYGALALALQPPPELLRMLKAPDPVSRGPLRAPG